MLDFLYCDEAYLLFTRVCEKIGGFSSFSLLADFLPRFRFGAFF
jgi:hypothetical protein